jgi:hypothetical protein
MSEPPVGAADLSTVASVTAVDRLASAIHQERLAREAREQRIAEGYGGRVHAMADDLPGDKTYAGAVIAYLRAKPSLTEEQRAMLEALAEQEERIASLEAILRREGKL